MYREIISLYDFCMSNGVTCVLSPLFDGCEIQFPNGGDFVQHFGSCGARSGCVEPAGIDPDLDYSAVSLEDAKALVIANKAHLLENAGWHDEL